MISNIESGNHNFTLNEFTSQHDRLYFVGDMIKYIGANEYDKHWSLVSRRELNRENTIMPIRYFKSNRAPYDKLIKHKYHMCTHGVMHSWGGVNYWLIYSTVVN